jgi:small-conductance mechanosensitive channel
MPFLDWLAVNGRVARSMSLALAVAVALMVWIGWFGGASVLAALYESGLIRVDISAVQSLALHLLAAAIMFAAVVYGTRFVQTILRQGVLTSGRIDQGIAYSIDKAVGYAGLGLAILYAASIAGFDLTGLTILAGALSVGVGFGLQTVISNFVCGLIVLIERPIKLGDWVVVKDYEGVVKHISVRSTEITTGNGASVLIPNSEFITGTVLNWTHGDPGGRVQVKIMVSPHSEPRAVLQALQAAMARLPGVLRMPAPDVSFDNLGGESLEFSAGAHLANINSGGAVRTEMRIAILEELRRAGIELATPQRQVMIRQGAEVPIANGARPVSPLS